MLLEIDRAHRPGVGGAAELPTLVDWAAFALAPDLRQMRVEIVVDDLVHQPEAVKGVAGIGDAPRGIGFDAILLDIAPGQCGAAQHDGQRQALPAHLLQVFAHHDGRFDEQTRHADGMRLVWRPRLQDRA